jgi:hypothetical protein
VLVPTVAAGEGINDIPVLQSSAEHADKTAEHLHDTYNNILATQGENVKLEHDQKTGRLSVTLDKDPDLTVAPIEQAFSRLNDTSDDVSRLKWLAIGGAVGLLSAAAVGRWDRSLRKGVARDALVDTARNHRGHFAALLLATGAATGVFWSTGQLQKDYAQLNKADMEQAVKVSQGIQGDIEKLNLKVHQGKEKTTVSFLPDIEAIGHIEKLSESLSPLLPEISEKSLHADEIMLSIASLALIGLSGTGLSLASSASNRARGHRRGSYHSIMERGLQELRDRELGRPAQHYPRYSSRRR